MEEDEPRLVIELACLFAYSSPSQNSESRATEEVAYEASENIKLREVGPTKIKYGTYTDVAALTLNLKRVHHFPQTQNT